MPYRLGVDLGTTFTAAAVADGSSEPTVIGLGNRALQIPSVLFLKPDGGFLVGEAAERRGLTEPDRLAREFKRRIGDHVPIMVAGAPFSPQALTAHLLRWVVDRASERMGGPPAEVILTHPANWGPFRLELLDQVAAMAGLTSARRCTEPEAAAIQYASQTRVPPGDRVAIYDLGGGTFDACVLEKTQTGFRTLGTAEGVEHLGGVDFDEAVLRHVLGALGAAAAALDPDDPAVTVGLARLRRDCVEAKEALSTDVDTLVPVALPGLSTTVRVTRAEFELMIRPALTETIAAMSRALHNAHVEPSQLRSILLVGGSSRIPLVSEMLHREFAVPTALDTHPKHDVALGSVRVGQDQTNPQTTVPHQTAPPPEAAAAHPVAREPTTVPTAAAPVPTAAGFAPTTGPDAGDAPSAPLPEAGAVPAAQAAVGSPPPPPTVGTPPGAAAGSAPPQDAAGDGPRPSGRLRVLAVVLAAVLLGVGAGVFIALSDRGTVASPPVTSAPPSSAPVSPSAATASATTPSPSPTPTPSSTPDPFAGLPASAPLDAQVIVWPRVRDGNWDVALLDLRTKKETRLTKGETVDWGPVISANRRTIMYTRIVDDQPTTRVMAANGTGDRPLFDQPPEDCFRLSRPAVSPTGRLVVTCNTEDAPRTVRLLVITLAGKIVRELDEGRLGDPTVTTDGRWVLYWRNDEGSDEGGALYRTRLDGKGSPARITNGGNGEDADPAVSPDGTQLAFSRDDGNGRNILTAPFDGKALTGNAKPWTQRGNNQDLSWSPDGRSIAYKRGPNDDGDLYVLDLATGKSRQAVENPEPDTVPAWTPR
jgi:actin-like ATPase involved in cell morphogenesis